MFLDKEYFDGWMQRLSERLERIEKLCAGGRGATAFHPA